MVNKFRHVNKAPSVEPGESDQFLPAKTNTTEQIENVQLSSLHVVTNVEESNVGCRTGQHVSSLEIDIASDGSEDERRVPIHLDQLSKARRLLYVSHLFTQFSEVSWQFCLVLFLGAFANYESLILVSTYGLVSGLAVCLSGPWVGRCIDMSNRLLVAQRFIWAENLSIVFATVFCYYLLTRGRNQDTAIEDTAIKVRSPDGGPVLSWLDGVPLDGTSGTLLVGIHLLGSIARVLDRGFLVSIERDWIVVMSQMASPNYSEASEKEPRREPDIEQKAWLSETNVAMKQIDLGCKIVAPALAGFFIAVFDNGTKSHHGGNLAGAALIVGAINVASLVVEYACTLKIYYAIPDLAFKAPSSRSSEELMDQIDRSTVQSELEVPINKATTLGCGICPCRLPYGIAAYFHGQMSMGGLGLALLYLNVMSFGSIMTAYLVWRGMGLETVGIWRGVSCAVGLFGTFMYHQSVRCLSLESTGMWSIAFQFICLSLSYSSLFVDDYTTSLAMLIGGICASRIGLWVFDIALTQQMQEYVPSHVRGVVGGVQEAMNAFFELLSFGLGIVFPDPRQFHIYVLVGYVSVGVAMVLYAFGVFFRRGKLVPQ